MMWLSNDTEVAGWRAVKDWQPEVSGLRETLPHFHAKKHCLKPSLNNLRWGPNPTFTKSAYEPLDSLTRLAHSLAGESSGVAPQSRGTSDSRILWGVKRWTFSAEVLVMWVIWWYFACWYIVSISLNYVVLFCCPAQDMSHDQGLDI